MNNNSSQHENDKVILAIENVFHHFTPSKAGIGDLFFTPNCIHYVTYFEFPPQNIIMPVGGRRLRRIDPRVSAAAHAAKLRSAQWGLNLHERLRRNKNAITISRSEIRNLNVNKNLSFEDAKGSTFEFEVRNPSKHQTALEAWLDGSLTEKQEHCVVAYNHTAPILVVEALLSGDQARLHSGELEMLAADDEYMRHLCNIVVSLKTGDRRAVLAMVKQIGGRFSDKVSVYYSRSRKRKLAQIGTLCLGGILFVAAMFTESSPLYLQLPLAIIASSLLVTGFVGVTKNVGSSLVWDSGRLRYVTKASSLPPQPLTH
jgi:hypothetical protein